MPFTLISGNYHLVGTRSGKPSGFEPDGDSIQFKPDNPALLTKLEQIGQPFRLSTIGSTQLRFEAIDALELHFGGSNQPRPLADNARDYLTGLLNLNPVPYTPPKNTRVKPPVQRDATPGFILSRSLEEHGRPVAFAYQGQAPEADGASINLKTPLLKRSLNFQSLANGNSYPLFYDTLFASFRNTFTQAAQAARQAKIGIWQQDDTITGLAVTDQHGLEATAVIFPKLFRRLTSFLAAKQGGMNAFLPWLQKTDEQVLDLTSNNFTHFDNVVAVNGNTVKLTQLPETLVFSSAKTSSPTVHPWLKH